MSGAPREPVRLEPAPDGCVSLVLDAGDDPFTFSSARLAAFERVVAELGARRDVRGVLVRATHPATFCAGADVDEIGALADRAAATAAVARGQEAFERLVRLPFPTVALIHGAALGGGCELALACGARTATAAAKIGLPETRLGILPAWGGSTRLPRLVGLVAAIEAITAGKSYVAAKALRLGLVDSVVAPEHLEREGLRLVGELAAGRTPPRPKPPLVARLLAATGPGRELVARKARAVIAAETKGFYPAPGAALDVLLAQHGRPVAEGFAAERERVVELLFGPVARELVRLFKLTRDGARPPVYADAAGARRVREVAVIGAGVMGAGIAQVCVVAGFPTRIVDAAPAALVRARAAIAAELKRRVARREFAPHEAKRRLAATTFSSALDGLAGVDLVVEAAPERREIKESVFKAVAAAVRPDALLATNTSSFPVGDLAAVVPRPERLLGLHFFNPAPKMPLVEVVRGAATSADAVARGVRFAKDLGKTPLVVGDGPGFLVNRLLAPYLDAACRLAATGVPVTVVDRELEAFGMPMGPFALMDTVGLDVLKDVGDHLAARGGPGAHPMVTRLVAEKRLGRKTGRGFYRWDADGKKGAPEPDAAPASDPSAGPHAAGSIAARLVDVMAAEARAALADGLVPTAEEIDLGTIFGVGFPPWRGGLMRHAAARAAAPGASS